MSPRPVTRMLVTAALVVAISADAGGIVHAAGGSTIVGSSTLDAAQQPIAAATTSSGTSLNDRALQSAKAASTTSTDSSVANQHGGGILADPRAAGVIASDLGVTPDDAAQALDGLIAMAAQKGGLDPRSNGFVAVASRLGVSPQRLAEAIDALKRALA
jgi:hypothetical protein